MGENKSNIWIVPSLLAGLTAAVFWSAADMLLVGFVPNPEKYTVISETLSSRVVNTDIALLMLDGSYSRLKWGVLLATFTIFLTIMSIYGVYRLMKPGLLSRACAVLLFIGASLAPLGHSGFFFVGIQAKSLLNATPSNLETQIDSFNLFYELLSIHWIASVALSSIGWLLFLWACISGKTVLPKKAAFLNPFILSIVVALISYPFKDTVIGALIGSAGLNIGLFVFFVGVLFLTGFGSVYISISRHFR